MLAGFLVAIVISPIVDLPLTAVHKIPAAAIQPLHFGAGITPALARPAEAASGGPEMFVASRHDVVGLTCCYLC